MSAIPTRELADHLPEPLTARPLTLADAPGVHAAVAAEETVDLGEPDLSLEDVISDWQRPSYDIATSTLGIFDGDQLVAYADVAGGGEAYTAVHPDHQGRGIGTALAGWVQATARARGYPRIGSQVPQGSAADRLMTDLGYQLRWTAWDLELPEGATISSQPLPEGFTIRDAVPADHETAWTVVEDAFTGWGDRDGCRSRTSPPGCGTVPASSRGTCAWSATRPAPSSARPTCTCPETATTAPATSRGSPSGRTGAASGWPGRCWSTPSGWHAPTGGSLSPVDGLADRRARSLPTRGHGGCLDLGQPPDRPVRCDAAGLPDRLRTP